MIEEHATVRRVAPGFMAVPILADAARARRRLRFSRSVAAVQMAMRLQTRLARVVEHQRGLGAARVRGRDTGHAVVLAYHAVADLREDRVLRDYGVPPERFAAQLDALRAYGWTFVEPDAVLAAVAGERRLPRRAVLVSFDDCYVDLLTEGAEILAARGIRALAFAVADSLGSVNTWDLHLGAGPRPLVDEDGLRALVARGIEIGSHGRSHRPLTQVPEADLDGELAGSAARLTEIGLPRPRALAYPHGAWSPSVARAASRAGYTVAFTATPGRVRRHSPPLALPRVQVLGGDTPRRLRLKLLTAGWPEPLRTPVLRVLAWL